LGEGITTLPPSGNSIEFVVPPMRSELVEGRTTSARPSSSPLPPKNEDSSRVPPSGSSLAANMSTPPAWGLWGDGSRSEEDVLPVT
jgi:hypothetical protein